LNKLGIWVIVIAAAFFVGILSANPVVEAVGGWQGAFDGLDVRITGLENTPTPKIQKQIESHQVDMTQSPLGQFVHHTFSCTNDGVIEGPQSFSTIGTVHGEGFGIRLVQQNGKIANVVVSDDFTTVDFDSKKTTGNAAILSVTLRCLSIVP